MTHHPSPDPLHWGSAINYDDDVGGTWGSPGHANGVLMQDGNITAGFNALNQPVAIWVSNVWVGRFGAVPVVWV